MSHVITEKMPEIVGQIHWSRALDIHQNYLKSVKQKKKPQQQLPRSKASHRNTTSRATHLNNTEFQQHYPLPPSPSASTAITLISLGEMDSKQGGTTTSLTHLATTLSSLPRENPLLSPCTLSSFADIQEPFTLQPDSIYHHHYQIKSEQGEEDMEMLDDPSSSAYVEEYGEPYSSLRTGPSLQHPYPIKTEYNTLFTTDSTHYFRGSSSFSMDPIPPIIRQTAETLLMVQKDVNMGDIDERPGPSLS